jgi:hypothetical protein
MRAAPQRWAPWIGVGVLAGIAMEIKILVAPLLLSCLLGVLIVGPRRRLAGPRPWVAALIALALGSPNLIWQAAHGFPMASVAANIASGGSTSSTSRAALLPTTLLDVGPVVSIVLVVGLVALLRTKQRRTVDGWIATGFLIFIAFLLITGGKAYYPAGYYPAILAAGAGPILDWARARLWRQVLAVGLLIISLIVTPSLTIPIFRIGSAPYQIATAVNPDLANEVGWPAFVDTVGQVVERIPPSDRASTIVVTESYQEASALELLRPANGVRIPPVYSGHNGYWYWGPPPDAATNAVVIGDFSCDQISGRYARCAVGALITSPRGVDNDLTGVSILLCSGRLQPWSVLWPQLRHFA